MSNDTLAIAPRFGSGQAVRRIEDEGLLKGSGQYTDDLAPQGQLRVVFLRSPYPHARITSIDVSGAVAASNGSRSSAESLLASAVESPVASGGEAPESGPDVELEHADVASAAASETTRPKPHPLGRSRMNVVPTTFIAAILGPIANKSS